MQTSPEFVPVPDVLPTPGKFGLFTLFSPHGRMGRAQFFYVLMLTNIVAVLSDLVSTVSENAPGIVRLIVALGLMAVGLLNVALIIICCIKRVHDWGKSGVHALKILIPFYSLILLFRAGDPGLNFYGERRYNPHIYWNAPLVILVPVLLMVGFASGAQALADVALSAPGKPYQDDRNGYTLTVPAGWTREPLEGDADIMQFFSADHNFGMYVTVRPYEDDPDYSFAEEDARAALDLIKIEKLFPDGYHASGEVVRSVEQDNGQWFARMESSGTVKDSPYRICYMGCVVDGYYYGLAGEQYGMLTKAKKDHMDEFMRSFRAGQDRGYKGVQP